MICTGRMGAIVEGNDNPSYFVPHAVEKKKTQPALKIFYNTTIFNG